MFCTYLSSTISDDRVMDTIVENVPEVAETSRGGHDQGFPGSKTWELRKEKRYERDDFRISGFQALMIICLFVFLVFFISGFWRVGLISPETSGCKPSQIHLVLWWNFETSF